MKYRIFAHFVCQFTCNYLCSARSDMEPGINHNKRTAATKETTKPINNHNNFDFSECMVYFEFNKTGDARQQQQKRCKTSLGTIRNAFLK